MKSLLITFCIITGLFGGGCALVAGGAGLGSNPLLFIPVAVFIFNLLVVLAVAGWSDPWKPAFYALAVVDVIIALATVGSFLNWGMNSAELAKPAMLLAGAFAVKGWLTWQFIRTA